MITISSSSAPQSNYCFLVSDNGIGLPPRFDMGQSNSLGMKLMKGLSEDIHGKLVIESKEGTTINVLVPVKSNASSFHIHSKTN